MPHAMLCPGPAISPFCLREAFWKSHRYGSAVAAERGQARCPRSHSPQVTNPGLVGCPTLRTTHSEHPPKAHPVPPSRRPSLSRPAWHPSASSPCFSSPCPRSDPRLAEPPQSPRPDPHVMKGINTAEPPARPSSFPAATARPLID